MLEELPNISQKKHPDLLVHIRISFDTMLQRIAKRGRPYEQISHDPGLFAYYRELNKRYDQWYDAYDASPKIQIDGDALNFVESTQAAKVVLSHIDQALKEIRM